MNPFIGMSFERLRFEHDKRQHQIDKLEAAAEREGDERERDLESHPPGTKMGFIQAVDRDHADNLGKIQDQLRPLRRELELIDEAIRSA